MTPAEDDAGQHHYDALLSPLVRRAVDRLAEQAGPDADAEASRARFYSWLSRQAAEEAQVAASVAERQYGAASAVGGQRSVSTMAYGTGRTWATGRAVSQTATVGGATGALNLPEADAPPLFSPRQAGPTVQRLVLGGHLRRLREQAGMTAERAAFTIHSSHSKISRMEHGRVGFKERDISDLLTLYGVGHGAEREALLTLAKDAKTPGWWQGYADILPHWVEPYFGLEAAASVIREFELQFVPGLLQTEEYARAVIRLGNLRSEEEIILRAHARVSRQDILHRPDPPRFWGILDEGALRRTIGGPQVMQAQLRHLIEMCDHPAVTLQILP
ncbi:MAG TPA: helix-turn-helix transcriptional regulator, partial [Trebonia sp.]